MQRGYGTHYECQWKLSPRAAKKDARCSDHLPSPKVLAPVIRQEGESLQQQLDRARFQNEFHLLARATAAAYIVRALRELGWTPELCAVVLIDNVADRLGLAPQYRKWLTLMLKELSADEMAATEEPQRLWKAAWNEFPECQVELELLRICGEQLPAVLRGHVDPLNLIFPEGELTATEHLYQDSPSFRFINLLAEKTIFGDRPRRLPKGKSLRILEVGGGTGESTSYILPVLPENRAEDVHQPVLTLHRACPAEIRPVFVRAIPHARYKRDPLNREFIPNWFRPDRRIRRPACHGKPA